MEPQVLASIIATGGTAVVAVGGIVGAWAGQGRAAKHALALFEEQAREQRELALIAERRHVYATFLQHTMQYQMARMEVSIQRSRACTRSAEEIEDQNAQIPKLVDEAGTGMAHAQQEIQLLAPRQVRAAANRWVNYLIESEEVRDAMQHRDAFLSAARADVGADDPSEALRLPIPSEKAANPDPFNGVTSPPSPG